MKPFRLNRRAVLRGAAGALALPTLEAMLDSKGRYLRVGHAALQKPPVRFLGLQMQNGCPLTWYSPLPAGAPRLPDERNASTNVPNVISDSNERYYDPRKVGEAFDLNIANKPLEPHKADIVQITGLHQRSLRSVFEHSDGAIACFVGFPMHSKPRDNRPERSSAPSLDWLLGKALAKDVVHPALYMSLRRDQPRMTNRDYTCSWIGDEQPATPVDTPRALAGKLFPPMAAMNDPEIEAERKRQRTILGFIRDDATRIQSKLGAPDRQRLEQHFEAIREVERQLDLIGANAESCGMPPATPEGRVEDDVAMPLMAKLVALGFACDVFRYGIFQVQMAWSKPGISENQHDHNVSHESWNKDNIYYWDKKMQYYAALIAALKATKEGEHNLLHNAILCTGIDVAQGPRHNFDNIPIILAGQAGGAVKTGRHLNHHGVTYNNLNCAILNLCGMNLQRYGEDGTGVLPGLGV